MKLLYCVLAICVAVNADPVSPSRAELQTFAKRILQDVEGAQESIDKLIATTQLTVEKKLVENKLVKKAKSTLEEKLQEAIKNGKSDDLLDCSISIIQGFQKLAADINNDLLQKLTERYGKQGDYLGTLKKELSDMKDALKNHEDEVIESCLKEQSKCKLTGEFLDKSEEFFRFDDLMKTALLSTVESSSDEYLNSVEVGHKIVTDFTHPAHECLNKTPQ